LASGVSHCAEHDGDRRDRPEAIQDFADALHESGRTLLLCGALPQPSRLMSQAEFHRHIGAENILPTVAAALVRADTVWRSGPRIASKTEKMKKNKDGSGRVIAGE
jgi:hypothetical protein